MSAPTDAGKERVSTGIAWSYGSLAVTALLQLAITAVLARLVGPAAFGLIAMAALVLRFGQYFAQFGLGQALVQAKQIDSTSIAAAFYTSLGLGAVAALLLATGAPVFATLFNTPEATPVFRVMSLSFVLSGSSLTSLALLRRRLDFRRIALVEVFSFTLGYGALGIGLAFLGAGVWSLVFALLGQSVLALVGYYSFVRHSLSPQGFRGGLRQLAGFGSRVSAIGFMEFIASNLDTLAVGRFLGEQALGFYGRGMSLANLPMQHLSTGVSRVLLPAVARMQNEPSRIRESHWRVTRVYAAIAIPVAVGMSLGADVVVAVLLGPGWEPAIPVLRLTSLCAVLTALTHFTEVVCEALAKLRLKSVLRVVQIGVFVGLVVVLSRYGLSGYAAAFAVSELVLWCAYLVVSVRVLGHRIADVVRMYEPAIGFGGATAVVLGLVRLLLTAAAAPAWGSLVALLLAGALTVATLALFWNRGSIWMSIRGVVNPGDATIIGRCLLVLDRVSGGSVR